MTPLLTWSVDVVLVVSLVATLITDLRWRRIPDWITLPAWLAGLVLGAAAGGWGPAGFDAASAKLLVALLLVLFSEFIATFLTDRVIDIADWVVAPAAILLCLWAIVSGFDGSERSFSSLLLEPSVTSALAGGLALWSFFRLLGYTGGVALGDVKLMGAVGSLLEFRSTMGVLVFVALAGGVQGLTAKLAQTASGRRLCARLGMSGTDSEEFARTVPYGVSIAMGALVFRCWQRLAT